ncbi:MAG: TRAP transporter large permease [Thermoleophilia bacterium]|nr:TRAP transporter large permease [Thermoleophilia bacterium]
MTPIMTGIVGLVVLLFLMFLGMPIGFAMLLVGFVGFASIVNFSGALQVITTVPYTLVTNYDYCVLPLFLLMAEICMAAGMGQSLYRLVYAWLGRIRGGLAVATLGACALFAAASSSSIATAATLGLVAIPEMRKYKYDTGLVAGCLASGGGLGILIPPSGVLILYGIMTQQSISKLFIAGIVPGIVLTLMFMLMIYIRARFNPQLAPAGEKTSLREKLSATTQSLEMVALLAVVIVGLIVGWFTPTEAGAAGALGALVLSLIRRRLSWQGFKKALVETLRTTGMIFVILMGALTFNSFLAVSTIPMELANWVSTLGLPPVVIMIFIIVTYFILGTFIDEVSMVLLTIPVFYPLVTTLGFDPIWFGIIIVMVVEVGMISPPVGMTLYVVKGIAQDIPMGTIFRGVIPFIIVEIIFIAILLAFPKIATFLPSLSAG